MRRDRDYSSDMAYRISPSSLSPLHYQAIQYSKCLTGLEVAHSINELPHNNSASVVVSRNGCERDTSAEGEKQCLR